MTPKIESLLLLAKFDDGLVRQIITTEEDQIYILHGIASNGSINVVEEPEKGIDWDSKFNLSEDIK